jgi:iron complex outermembrane recepter protein
VRSVLIGATGMFAVATAVSTQAEEAPPAPAPQTADSSSPAEPAKFQLEEIVVTARRREENLQTVPLSVTAINANDLNDFRILTPQELSYAAPQLTAEPNNGVAATRTQQTFFIRGQGTNAFSTGTPGVVEYFAEVPGANTSQFFDLSSVQVLAGAQGTLFGKATTGGAILLEPNKPTTTYQGYVDVRAGNYNMRELEAAVGGPVQPNSEAILFRVAVQGRWRDGYTQDIGTGRDLDNTDTANARFSLTLRPFDSFENDMIFYYEKIAQHGEGYILGSALDTGSAPFSTANGPLYSQLAAQVAAERASGPRVTDLLPELEYTKSYGAVDTATYEVDPAFRIKNIYSYRWDQELNIGDAAGTYLPILYEFQTKLPIPLIKTYTEELQFSGGVFDDRLHWQSGAYIDKSLTASPNVFGLGIFFNAPAAILPLAGLQGVPYPAGSATSSILYSATPDTGWAASKAAYAHLEYKFTDALTLSGGIRRTEDRGFTTSYRLPDIVNGTTAVPTASSRNSSNATTWDITPQYQFTRDVMGYVSARQGYRPGGPNANVAGAPNYLPESVRDYEMGMKTTLRLGDVQMRFNIDGYYDKYSDIQANVPFTAPGGGLPQAIIGNAGAANIKGIDLETDVVPSAAFDIALNYTYTDAAYTRFIIADQAGNPENLTGNTFPNVPKQKFTLTPRLHLPPFHGDNGVITLQAQISYQSGIFSDATNFSPLPGRTLTNLRADWDNMLGTNFDLGLFGTNVFNRTYIVQSNFLEPPNYSFGVISNLYGEPAMYGVDLRYKF